MRLTLTIEAKKNRLEARRTPIPPRSTDQVLIKNSRVLLTPIDHLLIKGLVNPGHSIPGTLSYGLNITPESIDEPQLVVTHPRSCDKYPVLRRRGLASELVSVDKKDIAAPIETVRLPEFSYIYSLVINAAQNLRGSSLVIGGDGLQTRLLSSLTDRNTVITGLEKKLGIRTESRIIGIDKLQGTTWDTILVWTMDTDKTRRVLSMSTSKKIFFHPFTVCLTGEITVNPEKHREIRVLHPPVMLDEIPSRMEEIVERSSHHDTTVITELPFIPKKPYITIVFRER